MGLGRGLVGLFKSWGKGIGNAADHVWLREEAQKAIKDEVTKKFQPKIDIAHGAESKRAANIKDLDAKLTQSKKDLTDAQAKWQDKYNSELAAAQNQRQTDIADYNTQLQGYQKALADANASRQSIFNKLRDDEDNYNPYRTIFTDVNTGERFIFNHLTGQPESLTKAYKRAKTAKEVRDLNKAVQGFGDRLYDSKSGKVINAFDGSSNNYGGKNQWFDTYYRNKISTQNGALRNADNDIKQAADALNNWKNNNSLPKKWNKGDLNRFEQDFEKNNAKPTYSFNGQNYSDEPALEKAYKDALASEQRMQSLFRGSASRYTSKRDAEIAKRIQDAKDMNKAKAFLVGALGGGALYAGARAMYGGDDTDNTNNTDNINNIDNTDYGNPDPKLKAENTPEGKAAIIGKSLIDTDFDPDKADAVATLAAASHDAGVEDSNSIESSDDHFIDDDELYGLLKAMEDPHKADAVANYIYSKHGNESDVQNLGWRGWLNKYYGDLLRSRMNLDPSSYNGMHISGGL